MLGLGIKKNSDIVDGIHLRWFFNPKMGFPAEGFYLFKRKHIECKSKEIRNWGSLKGNHNPPWHFSINNSITLIFNSDQKIHVTTQGISLYLDQKLKVTFPVITNKVVLTFDLGRDVILTFRIYFGKKYVEKSLKIKKGNGKNIVLKSNGIETIEIIVDRYDPLPHYNIPFHPPHVSLHFPVDFHLRPQVILSKISWIDLSECNCEWQRIGHFCLPIKDDAYPCKHEYQDNWEAAKSRLDEKKKDKYDIDVFSELEPYLKELVKSSFVPQHRRTKEERFTFKLKDKNGKIEKNLNEGKILPILRNEFATNGVFLSDTARINKMNDKKWEISDNGHSYKVEKIDNEIIGKGKSIGVNALQMVLLSALDPGVAQILGLYYIDKDVKDDQAYDYKIIGNWSNKTYHLDFSYLNLEKTQRSLKKDGFIFSSGNFIIIDKNNPLTVGTEKLYPLKIKEYLKIDFPRLLSKVGFDILRDSDSSVKVRVYKSDNSYIEESFDSDSHIIKFYEDLDYGFKSIEFFGDFSLYIFAYAEMDYAWIITGLKKEKRKPIKPPREVKTYLLPGKSFIRGENEEIVYAPATVGIKWDLSQDIIEVDRNSDNIIINIKNEEAHVLYKLQRKLLGEEKPQTIGDDLFNEINKGKPILVARLPKSSEQPSETPLKLPPEWPPQTEEEKKKGIPPIFYIDVGDKDDEGILEKPLKINTWYAYRVKGIDIFGRVSEPSKPVAIQVKDIFAPPPPLFLSVKFLDPKDPYLKKEEKEWVVNAENNETVEWNATKGWHVEGKENRRGFRVKWKWTENLRFQAPDAQKFKIYFKQGYLNLLTGNIVSVSDIKGLNLKGTVTAISGNQITFEVQTNKEINLSDVTNRYFKCKKRFYEIENLISSTFNNNKQVIVFTIKDTDEIKKDDKGVFDVDHSKIEVDFGEIEIDIVKNDFAGKILRQVNKNFRVIRNSDLQQVDGRKRVGFIVENLSNPREIPEANKPASFKIDPGNRLFINYKEAKNWKTDSWNGCIFEVSKSNNEEYDVFIPEENIPEDYRLSPTPNEPIAPGNIGITTVDKSGNESNVVLQPIFAVLREKPPAPGAPDIPTLWTTMPDFYGRAKFDVKWEVKSEEMDYFFQVYRTMEKTLMLVDIEEHKEGHSINEGVIDKIWSDGDNTGRKNEIENNLNELDEKIREWNNADESQKYRKFKELVEKYKSLRNDTWQYLASLPENEKAFSPVSKPLNPKDIKNWKEGKMSYKDLIEGKGPNRYFYRIGKMDKAGNRSPLGVSTPPVCVPDILPSHPPVITKALGGNKKSIIRFRRNTEKGMKRYEIYRTDKRENCADPRLMEKIAEINADITGMPLRIQALKNSAYVNVEFSPEAERIKGVYLLREDEQPDETNNLFKGFRSLIIKVSIDDGKVNITYKDSDNNSSLKSGLKVIDGKVKIELPKEENPLKQITKVYRTTNENLFEGISAGTIELAEASSYRGKEVEIKYTSNNEEYTVKNLSSQIEYVDDSLEAGAYYYRIVAVREGQIGEDENGAIMTEISSHPSKPVAVRVFDLDPPRAPQIVRIERVKIDEHGNEYSWDTQGYKSAIVIEWETDQPGIKAIVQRKTEEKFLTVSPWLYPEYDEESKKWKWKFYDRFVKEGESYTYCLKLMNTSGKISFSEEIAPQGGDENA